MGKIVELEAPSDIFEQAFRGSGGSNMGECEHCGRTVFCTGETVDYEPGEVDKLRAKAKAEPEKYVEDCDSTSVQFGEIDSKQFIMACGCNKIRMYENWIWRYRFKISEYLKLRAQEELEHAQSQKEVTIEAHEALGKLATEERKPKP